MKCRNLDRENLVIHEYIIKKYGSSCYIELISKKKDRAIYIVKFNENKWVAKYFCGIDARERYQREKFFYQSIRSNSSFAQSHCSYVVSYDDDIHVLFLNYIPSKIITNTHDEKIFITLKDFLSDIQNCKECYQHPTPLYASDSACSLYAHYQNIKKRLARLLHVSQSHSKEELNEFLLLLANYLDNFECHVHATSIDWKSVWVSEENLIVSPSDIGWHNILIKDDNLYFIDFEHAGLDDPAKLLCDAILNPKYALPRQWHDELLLSLERIHQDTGLSERTDCLMPVFIIRWCCILCSDALKQEGEHQLGEALQLARMYLDNHQQNGMFTMERNRI